MTLDELLWHAQKLHSQLEAENKAAEERLKKARAKSGGRGR